MAFIFAFAILSEGRLLILLAVRYKKYKSLSPAIKVSLWFIVCSVFQKGISLFAAPIYTRMLSTTEYGVYSVYLSWVNILYIFATLNMSAGVFNNGMIKYEDRRDQFTSTLQGLSTITCIGVGFLLFVFMKPVKEFTQLKTTYVVIMIIQNFFTAPFSYWTVRKRFEYKYRGIVITTLIISLGTPSLAIGLMYVMPDRSDGIIFGTAIVQIAVGCIFYINNWIKGRKFYDKEIWKYGVLFNIPLIPHYLSYVILNQADRVMINSYCGASDAGIYSLAYQIALVINLVTNAIDASFNPWTYQKLKEKDNASIRRISNHITLIFGVGAIGLTLIAPEVLAIIAPSEYQSAKWVIPPVIAGCFCMFVAGSFMRIEFYHERNKIIMVASTSTAILNIILNAVFIPKFGYIAAAYTTLVSYFLFSLFHYFVMVDTCRRQGYKCLPFNGKGMFGIVTITLVLMGTIMSLYQLPEVRYGIVIVICVVSFMYRKFLTRLFREMIKKRNTTLYMDK